jgi:hypothetical protein
MRVRGKSSNCHAQLTTAWRCLRVTLSAAMAFTATRATRARAMGLRPATPLPSTLERRCEPNLISSQWAGKVARWLMRDCVD